MKIIKQKPIIFKNACDFLEFLRDVEPELYNVCAKECIYRNGICPKLQSCGYNKTTVFKENIIKLRDKYEEAIKEILEFKND